MKASIDGDGNSNGDNDGSDNDSSDGARQVYRIRRRSDGRYYGRRQRFGGEDSVWKVEAGRYLTRPALIAILRGFAHQEAFLADIEVVTYKLAEIPSDAAPRSVGAFLRGRLGDHMEHAAVEAAVMAYSAQSSRTFIIAAGLRGIEEHGQRKGATWQTVLEDPSLRALFRHQVGAAREAVDKCSGSPIQRDVVLVVLDALVVDLRQ